MSDIAQATAPQPESPSPVTSRYDAAEVIRHLAHELRQPLSTIESIAYYLEIILPKTNSKAREQVGKLQQMVHQSNWILTDAIHFLQAAPPRPDPGPLRSKVHCERSFPSNSTIASDGADMVGIGWPGVTLRGCGREWSCTSHF